MQGGLPLVCAALCAALPLPARAQALEAVSNVQQLIEHALAHNPDLLAARQRLAVAQGLLRQAGLRPNPSIEVSIGNGDALGSAGEREYAVGFAQTLELGGKRRGRVEAAQLETELVRLEIAERERQLRAEVRTRHAEALAAMRNLGNTQRVLGLTRQSLELAEARAREGESAPIEANLLRVEVNRIDSDRVLFQGQVERAVLELKLLAGLDEGGALSVGQPLAPPALEIEEARALELAASRPDLRAAQAEERLAASSLRLARAQAVPDVTASGGYRRSQARFDQYGFTQPGGALVPLRDTDNMLSAGVSITLPWRNRNQGNIEAAVAGQRAAQLRRQALERAARQQVQSALVRYRAVRQALGLFEQGVIEQSQDNLKVLRGAYELGELRLLDVLNEQRRLLDAQRAYTDLLRDANVAAAELERAVGAPLEVTP